MTISATDILVPVCSKIPLLYLLTQKVAQKFGYVLGIKYELLVKCSTSAGKEERVSLLYLNCLTNLIFNLHAKDIHDFFNRR